MSKRSSGNSFGGVKEDSDSEVAGMYVPGHPAKWEIFQKKCRQAGKMLAIATKNYLE